MQRMAPYLQKLSPLRGSSRITRFALHPALKRVVLTQLVTVMVLWS